MLEVDRERRVGEPGIHSAEPARLVRVPSHSNQGTLTMITVPRKALPRRGPNRVQLVEPDGSPARPSAESWPAWTDNHFYETGPESESDAQYLARITAEEQAERERIEAAYQPLPEDLAEYATWCAARENGTLPADVADRFRFGEYDAYRHGQPTDDELAQLASHGCI